MAAAYQDFLGVGGGSATAAVKGRVNLADTLKAKASRELAEAKRREETRQANAAMIQQRKSAELTRDHLRDVALRADPGPEGQRYRALKKQMATASVDWRPFINAGKVLATGAAVIATGGAVAGAVGLTAGGATLAATTAANKALTIANTADKAMRAAKAGAATVRALERGDVKAATSSATSAASKGAGALGVSAPAPVSRAVKEAKAVAATAAEVKEAATGAAAKGADMAIGSIKLKLPATLSQGIGRASVAKTAAKAVAAAPKAAAKAATSTAKAKAKAPVKAATAKVSAVKTTSAKNVLANALSRVKAATSSVSSKLTATKIPTTTPGMGGKGQGSGPPVFDLKPTQSALVSFKPALSSTTAKQLLASGSPLAVATLTKQPTATAPKAPAASTAPKESGFFIATTGPRRGRVEFRAAV